MGLNAGNYNGIVWAGSSAIGVLQNAGNKVKSDGITYNKVKTFVENQVSQMYGEQPRIKYYFPNVAKEINEIWQIDMMDVGYLHG